MEKRVALAIVLSLLIVVGFSWVTGKLYPPRASSANDESAPQPSSSDAPQREIREPAETPSRHDVSEAPSREGVAEEPSAPTHAEPTPEATAATPLASAAKVTAASVGDRAEPFIVGSEERVKNLAVTFDPTRAGITAVVMKQYNAAFTKELLVLFAPPEGARGIGEITPVDKEKYDFAGSAWEYDVSRNDDGTTVVFTLPLTNGLVLTKTFTLPADGDTIDCRLTVASSTQDVSFQYWINGPAGISAEDRKGRYIEALVAPVSPLKKMKLQKASIGKLLKEGERSFYPDGDEGGTVLDWVGLRNRYFVGLMRAGKNTEFTRLTMRAVPDATLTPEGLSAPLATAGRSTECAFKDRRDPVIHSYRFVFTPISRDSVKAHPYLMELRGTGWFAALKNGILWILVSIHSVTGNYGVAIIIMTVLIRILLFPLQYRQMLMSYKSQNMRPHIKALQEKYKNNRQKLAEEQMKLMKEHGVNPMGCLGPMIIQMPIFIALFRVLGQSIELRQQPFILWMTDLAQPDRFIANFMGTGFDINLLPILNIFAMIGQMKLQPQAMDPQGQKQQKTMMLMPLFFGVIFYPFASGLLLYWMMVTIIGMVEQLIIRKHLRAKGVID